MNGFRFITVGAVLVVVSACGSDPDPSPPEGHAVPVALTKPIRHHDGAIEETLAAIPKTFVLSFRCDSEGRRSLVFSPYPPMATTRVSIEAGGKEVARGDVAEGVIEGPFLRHRFQSAVVNQVTGAATARLNVFVTFGQTGECEVENMNVTAGREPPSGPPGISLNRNPLRPTALSRDGTIAIDLPEGWTAADVSASNESLTVGSFPLPNRVTALCPPSGALSRMPEDGALIRVSEQPPGTSGDVEADSGTRADGQSFSLRKSRRDHECGAAFAFDFRQNGRQLYGWVWVDALGYDQEVQRQVTSVLNSLQVESPQAAPVRMPFLALDCRNPPNTLGCDRVFVAVDTRRPMHHLSIRIRRWSAKTPGGWMYSDSLKYLRTELSPGIRPGRRMAWTGRLRPALLSSTTSTMPVRLPTEGKRWVGDNPPIRADVEVNERLPDGRKGGTWTFRHVELIAGHG